MKTIKVTFYHDSGHGWYRVKRSVLEELNLLEHISSFSYVNGASVYLEEDRDASIFYNTVKKLGLSVEEKQAKFFERSPIRSYHRFQKPYKQLNIS